MHRIKIFLGFKIEGKENKIKDSGFVSISNHIHYLDCTFIGLINYPNRVYYPTIQENFKIPFVRHLIKLLCAIPIPKERKHKDKFYKQINEALEKNNIFFQKSLEKYSFIIKNSLEKYSFTFKNSLEKVYRITYTI